MNESPVKCVLRRVAVHAAAWRTAWLRSVLAAAFGVLIAGCISSSHSLAVGQEAGSAAPACEGLAPGKVLGRRMEAGETHCFELAMTPGNFAQVVVAQRGVDVAVKAFAPDGSLLIDMDSPNGAYGLETVSVVAQVAGRYRIEVYSDKNYPSGDYELRVEGPRASSVSDERRVTAERIFTEAQQLRGSAGMSPATEAGDKYNAAIRKYEEALGIWRELGDLRGQGYSLSSIGRCYRSLGQLQPALDYLSQALSRLREAQDISGQAFVLNETGAAHRELGNALQALESYVPALELRIGINDIWGQAQLYNNIGLIYSNVGSQSKAIQNFEKALSLWRGMGQRSLEMNALANTAKAYAEMGRPDVALGKYQEVLKFCETEDSTTKLKPVALNGLGLVYDTWADSEQALANYQQALELFRAADNLRGEADVLDNIGMAHAFLGDAPKSLEYFREALVIRQRLNEPKGWAMTLSNIGYAETLLGDYQEALKQLALALPLSEQARDLRFQAYTLVRTGMANVSLGDPRKALEVYERALAIQSGAELQDARGQAITLDKIGEALALSGEVTEALRKYERALELWKAVGDKQGQALSLYGIAHVELGRNNLANARDRIEEAIEIVESLRYKVSGRQLRMTYFAAKQDFYALDIDARTRLYELTHSAADMEAALLASERARARSLLDLLSEAHADPHKGMPPSEAEASRRREDKISELRQTFFHLRSLGKNAEAAVIEQKLAAYIDEQDEHQTLATNVGAYTAEKGRFRPLIPREIQQLLDPDTLLLQYSLGEERSHLWMVSRTEIEHHFLAGRAELEKAAEQLRQALTSYEPRRPGESVDKYLKRWEAAHGLYCQSARDLSSLILGQVSARLGNKRLVIVADGALQYIPFEALPLPQAAASNANALCPSDPPLLLSQNEVVYQPSASTLALLRGTRQRNALKTVAVFADPVFDSKDERVRPPVGGRAAPPQRPPDEKSSHSSEKLSRSLRDLGDLGDGDFTLPKLEYSLKEANAITSAARSGSWMKPTAFVGFKANRAAAMSPMLKQFSIIHFATHGILNDKHPELSGIVLSMVNEKGEPEDGYLTLHDIYNLDLPVNLVVLSACQTGIGKHLRGEGLLGLTRGFMYAGASRVVASLWRMDDEASAELMRRFYLYMLGKNRMSASTALRKAKLEMVGAGGEWSAPSYWAGFVVQGDWK